MRFIEHTTSLQNKHTLQCIVGAVHIEQAAVLISTSKVTDLENPLLFNSL